MTLREQCDRMEHSGKMQLAVPLEDSGRRSGSSKAGL